jgi:hypothetical protein
MVLSYHKKLNMRKVQILYINQEDVFRKLKRVCERNGFKVLSEDLSSGIITAQKKYIFSATAVLTLQRTEKQTAGTTIEINVLRKNKPDEEIEEKIMQSLYKSI